MYAQETVCLIFIQFYNENKHLISSHRQTTLAVPMIYYVMGINCEAEQKEGERVGKWINHFDSWIKKKVICYFSAMTKN